MDFLNSRALKQTAAQRLSRASYDPKKLALMHAAVALGAGLLLNLLDLTLSRQVANTTSGLSGMDSRSMLQTAQTVLQYIFTVLMPFWNIGFLHCAIAMARNQATGPRDLTEGFRRFGPVLRLQILKILLFSLLGFLCMYTAAFFISFTPFAEPIMELMTTMQADSSITEQTMTMSQIQAALYEIPLDQLWQILRPVLILFGILYVGISIPTIYRYRMADFVLMDEPGTRAMLAMRSSGKMMRRNCIKLFRLDLSFWWFYLLLVLTMVVGNGNLILSAMGITLPLPPDVSWLLFYVLQILLQLVLYRCCYSHMQTTYALAYDALRQQKPVPPKPQTPSMKNTPWESLEQQ